MQINHITLSFTGEDAHLEEGFLKNYQEKSIHFFRIAMIMGFFLYTSFAVLDAILFPNIKEKFWFIRFVLVCPFGLSALALSYTPLFKRCWQALIAVSIFTAGLGIIAMMIIAPQPYNFTFYSGLILVLFYSYTVPRALFVWASIVGWTLFLCYEILALYIIATPEPIFYNNNFFFAGANIVGMIASYFTEYFARNTYWLMKRLEEETNKVQAINNDLQDKNRALEVALDNVKTLSGFLPICMHCKKIRDDAGYWNQIEIYLRSRTEAEFSHCLCPECAKERYPDIYEEIMQQAPNPKP